MDLELCRVCLKKEDELYYILDSITPPCSGRCESVLKFYDFIREILITKEHQNIKHICQKCRSSVQNVYILLEQCEKSNVILSEKNNLGLEDIHAQEKITEENAEVKICAKDVENFDVSSRPVDEGNDTAVEVKPVEKDVNETFQNEDRRDADEGVVVVIMEETDERMLFGAETIKDGSLKSSPKRQTTDLQNSKAEFSGEKTNTLFSDGSIDRLASDLANAINDDIEVDINETAAIKSNAPNEGSGCETIDLSSPEPPEGIADTETRHSNETNKSVSELQTNQFKCGICESMVYKTYQAAHRVHHMKHAFRFFSVVLDKDMICLKCHESFQTAYLLKNHIKSKHPPDENTDDVTQRWYSFICLICFRGNLEPHLLQVHIHNHMIHAGKGKNFECLECSANYISLDGLHRHVKALHDMNPFPCNICSARFRKKSDLLKHIVGEHGKEKLFTCKICSSVSVYESDLIEHTMDCDAKYSCNRCNFKFANTLDMRAHEAYHKSGSHKCDDCKLSFTAKGFLKQHLAKHLRDFYCTICKRYIPEVCKYTHHFFRHIRNGEIFNESHIIYPNEKQCPSRKRKSTPEPSILNEIPNETDTPPIKEAVASTSNQKKALIIRSENKCYIIVPKTDDGLIPSGSAGLQITFNGTSLQNRNAAVTNTPQGTNTPQTASSPHRMIISQNNQVSSASESNLTIVIGDSGSDNHVGVRESDRNDNRLHRHATQNSGLQIAKVYSGEGMSVASDKPTETLKAFQDSAYYPPTLVHGTEGDFLISEIHEDDFNAANEYRIQSFDRNSIQMPTFQGGNHCNVDIPRAILNTLQKATTASLLKVNNSGQPGLDSIANTVNIVIDSSDEDD